MKEQGPFPDLPEAINMLDLAIIMVPITEILFSPFQVSQSELITNGRSFSSSDQTGNSSITTLSEDEMAAAFLPASLFQSIPNHDNIGSFYAVYNTGVLFPIAKAAQRDQGMNTSVTTVVGSPVFAATVGFRQSFSELTEPVRILLRLNDLGVSDRNVSGSSSVLVCVLPTYIASFPGPAQLPIACFQVFIHTWKEPGNKAIANPLTGKQIETCILSVQNVTTGRPRCASWDFDHKSMY